MKEDIIEVLKRKEKEMEAVLEEARAKAVKLRQEAEAKAVEIGRAMGEEVEQEVRSIREARLEEIDKELKGIEEGAEESLGELRARGAERRAGALALVEEFVLASLTEPAGEDGGG